MGHRQLEQAANSDHRLLGGCCEPQTYRLLSGFCNSDLRAEWRLVFVCRKVTGKFFKSHLVTRKIIGTSTLPHETKIVGRTEGFDAPCPH